MAIWQVIHANLEKNNVFILSTNNHSYYFSNLAVGYCHPHFLSLINFSEGLGNGTNYLTPSFRKIRHHGKIPVSFNIETVKDLKWIGFGMPNKCQVSLISLEHYNGPLCPVLGYGVSTQCGNQGPRTIGSSLETFAQRRAYAGCPLRKITPAIQERNGLMGETWASVQSVWQENRRLWQWPRRGGGRSVLD